MRQPIRPPITEYLIKIRNGCADCRRYRGRCSEIHLRYGAKHSMATAENPIRIFNWATSAHPKNEDEGRRGTDAYSVAAPVSNIAPIPSRATAARLLHGAVADFVPQK